MLLVLILLVSIGNSINVWYFLLYLLLFLNTAKLYKYLYFHWLESSFFNSLFSQLLIKSHLFTYPLFDSLSYSCLVDLFCIIVTYWQYPSNLNLYIPWCISLNNDSFIVVTKKCDNVGTGMLIPVICPLSTK